jgi:hypothetical protein
MIFLIDPNAILGPKPCPTYVNPCSTKCGSNIVPLYGVPLYGVPV